MSRCALDHIVIAAPGLARGAEYVREALGVAPQPGGEHPRMGTHNMLLRLGESCYLEVIAPNPQAAPPGQPRWFGLDALAADAPPALAAWVARTEDIHSASAACTEPLGAIEPMSRGTLSWHITIPEDGVVPLDGVAPALIQWHAETHPAARLPEVGLSLVRLELCHPQPGRAEALLASLGLDDPVCVTPLPPGQRPHLVAHLVTPRGRVTISQFGPVTLSPTDVSR